MLSFFVFGTLFGTLFVPFIRKEHADQARQFFWQEDGARTLPGPLRAPGAGHDVEFAGLDPVSDLLVRGVPASPR
jgi:hypothetical protein